MVSSNRKSHFIWVKDAFVAEYERDLEFFYSQLIELNVDIYILEHVLQFPIELFSDRDPEKSIFLVQVIDNFLDQSILIITKLVRDQDYRGKRVHTLSKFKKQVVQHTKDEYREALQRLLRNSDFGKKTARLLEKAEHIRDKRIAHFDPCFFREPFNRAIRSEFLLFSEIKVLRDELNTFFEALSFGAEYDMLPSTYKNNTSDIEWILDGIARSSNILNMPEENPDRWQHERHRLTEDELSQINLYRKKFGLREVGST